jgi:hypothetical protein
MLNPREGKATPIPAGRAARRNAWCYGEWNLCVRKASDGKGVSVFSFSPKVNEVPATGPCCVRKDC